MTAILEPQTSRPVDTVTDPAVRPTPAPEPVRPQPVQPESVLPESVLPESVLREPVLPEPVLPVAQLPVADRPVPAEPVRTKRVLRPTDVRIVAAALIVLFAIGVSVQPPADGANPVEPWWADVLNVIIQVGLFAVLAGLLTGRRWTVHAGLVTGASLLLLSITCPLEGHHVVAAWWFVQMAVGIAMTALPAAVLRRTQAAAKAG